MAAQTPEAMPGSLPRPPPRHLVQLAFEASQDYIGGLWYSPLAPSDHTGGGRGGAAGQGDAGGTAEKASHLRNQGIVTLGHVIL